MIPVLARRRHRFRFCMSRHTAYPLFAVCFHRCSSCRHIDALVTQDIGRAVFKQLPAEMQRSVSKNLYRKLRRDQRRQQRRELKRRAKRTGERVVLSSSSDDSDDRDDGAAVDAGGGWDDENDAELILEGKLRRPQAKPIMALVVPGLQPGRFYSFRVIAYNAAGASESSPPTVLGGLGV